MTEQPPGLRGFAIPPEWAPHRATWIAWPHERTDWPGKFPAIRWIYGELVRVLSRGERVAILVENQAHKEGARAVLTAAGANLQNVEFHRIPTDRSWLRDSGPIFLRNRRRQKIATDWKFNGWAKYPNHKRDDRVARLLARAAGIPAHRVVSNGREIVLEGGAIDVDGAGNLLCTEECLLSDVQSRNPGLARNELESILRDVLGVRRVIWLCCGIAGDDTHGHVDDVARFVAEEVVLLCQEKNSRDDNYAALEENRERLEDSGVQVVRLPMPSPLTFAGKRLPASYANFYIANTMVIVPTFNDPQDRHALGMIAEFFPEREITGIYSVDLLLGLGALHCATLHEPE